MQPTHKQDDNWARVLVRVGGRRDRVAFKHLFNHFAPLIRGFCLDRANLALSAQTADELVQETMFRVWQKAPYFDPNQTSASAWIFSVARNCRIEQARVRKSQRSEQRLNVDDIWGDATENLPFVFLHRAGAAENLRDCLQNLPLEQFHLMKKMFMESKSHNTISTELGLPVNTVKSRMRLALKKLQTARR